MSTTSNAVVLSKDSPISLKVSQADVVEMLVQEQLTEFENRSKKLVHKVQKGFDDIAKKWPRIEKQAVVFAKKHPMLASILRNLDPKYSEIRGDYSQDGLSIQRNSYYINEVIDGSDEINRACHYYNFNYGNISPVGAIKFVYNDNAKMQMEIRIVVGVENNKTWFGQHGLTKTLMEIAAYCSELNEIHAATYELQRNRPKIKAQIIKNALESTEEGKLALTNLRKNLRSSKLLLSGPSVS